MRKRFKIPIGVLIVFLLAIAVTLLILTKTSFLERRVNEFLKGSIEEKYGLKIELGDIGGSIFSGFSISDIDIRYGEGDSQYRLASIRYLEVDYDLSDILNGRWVLQNLYLDSVEITARKRPDGALDIPQFGGGGAGESGLFDFSIDSLTVANFSASVPGDPDRLLIDDLSLFCSLARGRNLSQIELVSSFFRMPEYDISRAEMSGTITIVDSLVVAEDVRLVTDSSAVSFDVSVVNRKPLEFHADLDQSRINLQELEEFTGIGLNGDAAVSGDVDGVGGHVNADVLLSGCLIGWEIESLAARFAYSDKKVTFETIRGEMFGGRVDGRGFIDFTSSPNSYQYAGAFKDFNLNTVVAESFDTRLSGDVVINGSGLSNTGFELDFSADLDWSRFDAYTFDSLSGDFHLNKDSIVFAYPFNLFYRSTSLEAGGVLEYSGNMYIEGEAQLPVIAEFKNQIFLEDIGGRGVGNFTLSGPTNDPGVSGSFNSDSVVIYDLTSMDFLALVDIRHFFTEPEGEVEIFSGGFDYNGLAGDLLQTNLQVEPDRVWIDRATASIPPFDLNGVGRLDIEEDSLLLTFTELTARIDSQIISIDREAEASFSDTGINVLALELSGGADRLTATGSYMYDSSMDFTVQYDTVRVGSWLPYFYDDYTVNSWLSGRGNVSGSLVDPVLAFDLTLSSTVFEGEPIGDLAGRVAYRDSVLSLEDAILRGARNTSTVDGYIPLDLAFESREARLLKNNPLGLTLSVSGNSFDLLEVFFEDLEWFTGVFAVDVTMSGTPAEFDLAGAVSVDDGICKIYYIEDPIEEINFSGEFDRHSLTIVDLNGKLSRGDEEGNFDVSGSLDLRDLTKPRYDLAVIGSNLPVKYDLGDIECLIEDVDLIVTGANPPVATGDVDIAQFLYQEPFFEDIETDALEAADTVETFDYNIHISIPRNMWIKNEDTDVELKGDLIVLKEGKLENFLGTLEIVRGKFYLTSFNRTFDFEPGGIIRFDNIEKFNPLLEDIRMRTTIRDSAGTREITLQISDSLENPSIDVPPGSDYTLDEVWVFMNPIGSGFAESEPTDMTGNGARSSIGDRLTVGATGMALNQASRLISRQLGVETFELTTSSYGRTFNPLETELTIGFYTTPRLYIYGASQLSFSKAEEYGFDYRLSKRVFISGRRDRKNLFELNLNLNWEFK